MGKRSKSLTSHSRHEETKDAAPSRDAGDRFLSISFKHFCDVDDIGQSISTWAEDGVLKDLLDKLFYITANGITDVMSNGVLVNYRRFPESSVCDFTCPNTISKDEDWGVIKYIGGQKRRVAGFMKNNVFFVVFLDRDHRFWKSSR